MKSFQACVTGPAGGQNSAGPFRFRHSSSPSGPTPTRRPYPQGWGPGGLLVRRRGNADTRERPRTATSMVIGAQTRSSRSSARPAPYPLSRQYRALPLSVIGPARPHQGQPGLIDRRTISRPLPIGKRPYRGQRPASVAKRPHPNAGRSGTSSGSYPETARFESVARNHQPAINACRLPLTCLSGFHGLCRGCQPGCRPSSRPRLAHLP